MSKYFEIVLAEGIFGWGICIFFSLTCALAAADARDVKFKIKQRAMCGGLLAQGADHDACVNRSCHARREIVNWESIPIPILLNLTCKDFLQIIFTYSINLGAILVSHR